VLKKCEPVSGIIHWLGRVVQKSLTITRLLVITIIGIKSSKKSRPSSRSINLL